MIKGCTEIKYIYISSLVYQMFHQHPYLNECHEEPFIRVVLGIVNESDQSSYLQLRN